MSAETPARRVTGWSDRIANALASFRLSETPNYARKLAREVFADILVRRPRYREDIPDAARACLGIAEAGDRHSRVVVGPGTIGALATSPETLREVIQILRRMQPDEYVSYLIPYYESALARYGDRWRYADIGTVLLAASRLIRPRRYLEIGVRRGRSMTVVASETPDCDVVGFDLWIPMYGGADNPGAELVKSELAKVGHRGKAEFVTGDGHVTVPRYFAEHPDAYFDLVTVDGDHSRWGASLDLQVVLPRISRGGAIVFDDIVHPLHPWMGEVWDRFVTAEPRFSTWTFSELGLGIGVGIRR